MTYAIHSLIVLLSVVPLIACSNARAEAQTPRSPTAKTTTSPHVQAYNNFALQLLQHSGANDTNVALTPISLATTLSMIQLGARGTTAQELAAALGTEPTHVGTLLREMRTQDTAASTLLIANALWGDPATPWVPTFAQANQTTLDAAVNTVDFAQPTAVQTINTWCHDNTRGHINDILSPDSVDATTHMVATNAVYFKGLWQTPFDPARTKAQPFKVNAQTSVDVPTMHHRTTFAYAEVDDTQLVELPYEGGQQALLLILPPEGQRLDAFERTLTADTFTRLRRALEPHSVLVALPRLTLNQPLDAVPVLQALGVKHVFSAARADLSGISTRKGLILDAVVHRTMIDINEVGTEAAAATAAVTKHRSRRNQKTFRANRPFIFALIDQPTGAIISVGHVVNPR